jgi:tRNA (cmo5U34)-methyltransferase
VNNDKDNLFAGKQNKVSDFVFDSNVAGVFEDMINRSVPGYAAIINMIGMVAKRYVKPQTNCYDLGCSLGASSLSMARNIDQEGVKIIAIDNSQAMVDSFVNKLSDNKLSSEVEVLCDDICNVTIERASMVVLNFTLQFFNPQRRKDLVQKIYDGMCEGAVLVVSEKIDFDDEKEKEFQTEMHHVFKGLQGYSDLEISQKRTALENVLIPDTLDVHKERLTKAGFSQVDVWFQCFNFVSLIARK